ncbi:MAG: DedA family protein [Candidatus Omnitrophota bacterium]
MLEHNITGLIARFGDIGIFLGMFFESSIIPIPSEVVIAGAAAVGIPILSIVIFGSLGSTLGAMLGYALGRYAALPVVLKFGRFILIKPHHIAKAEAFAKKYGAWSVLIGRVLPVIPFKVFSITAGITKINFPSFVLFTLIGVVPRIYILSLCGLAILRYKTPALIIISVLLLIFLFVKCIRRSGCIRAVQKNIKPDTNITS